MRCKAIAFFAAASFATFIGSAEASDIVAEWATVKPAAPTLKPVTVEAKTTALLVLDFMKQNCGKRPRCVATLAMMP